MLRCWPNARAFTAPAPCSPMPADETFEQRLFGPYQDAFPPPSRVHPGHLVVSKPDLGPEHWAAAGVAECRCGGAAGVCCAGHAGGGGGGEGQPCRLCAKEAALRSYDGPTFFAVPGNHDWCAGCGWAAGCGAGLQRCFCRAVALMLVLPRPAARANVSARPPLQD